MKTNEYNINLNLFEDYILFVLLFINTSIIYWYIDNCM